MIIIGLDIAGKTGMAVYDTDKPICDIMTQTAAIPGETPEEEAANLAVWLAGELIGINPDLVMIEEPLRYIVAHAGKVNAKTVTRLNQLAGAAVAVCAARAVKWRTVPIQTWRKKWFGAARITGRDRAGWKAAAVARAKSLGIDVRSNDAAEAIGIAFAGAEYQPRL